MGKLAEYQQTRTPLQSLCLSCIHTGDLEPLKTVLVKWGDITRAVEDVHRLIAKAQAG